MNLRFFTAVFSTLLLSGASALAQTSAWTIDTNHTQVDFQIRRVPVSNVRGSFGGITGTVNWNEKDPSKSSVEVVIPTASISTANSTRDADLKSPNFFNIEKYPTMTFKSTAVSGTSGKLQIVGDLTLAGVTKSVTLAVDGPTPPTRMGKLIIGFAATGILKRSDFNFASKYPTAILGDEIKFTIDAEADK
ncbi:YceI family protein [Acidicapsa ligni]|uniref:YceI family protein n=1 Tax=Acidicapsa ligni TaxID=542300 RepID=UPI0021DF4BB6|nr:YceI family protein [Acidicapsa ligni]